MLDGIGDVCPSPHCGLRPGSEWFKVRRESRGEAVPAVRPVAESEAAWGATEWIAKIR